MAEDTTKTIVTLSITPHVHHPAHLYLPIRQFNDQLNQVSNFCEVSIASSRTVSISIILPFWCNWICLSRHRLLFSHSHSPNGIISLSIHTSDDDYHLLFPLLFSLLRTFRLTGPSYWLTVHGLTDLSLVKLAVPCVRLTTESLIHLPRNSDDLFHLSNYQFVTKL